MLTCRTPSRHIGRPNAARTRRMQIEDEVAPADGLDGSAIYQLLQGAVLKGADPLAILSKAQIDPIVYGASRATIDGRALVRLIRGIQHTLDDVYLGFFAQ